MKIQIGQIFRVPPTGATASSGDYVDIYKLAPGAHRTSINVNRGIFHYRNLKGPDGEPRIPAFLLYSDNLRSLSETNPWLDVLPIEVVDR